MARTDRRTGYFGIGRVYESHALPLGELLARWDVVWETATLYWTYHPETGYPAFSTKRDVFGVIDRGTVRRPDGGTSARALPPWSVVDHNQVRARRERLVVTVPKRFFADYEGNTNRSLPDGVRLDPVPEFARVEVGTEYLLLGATTSEGVVVYLLTWADLAEELDSDRSPFGPLFPTTDQRAAFVDEFDYDPERDPAVKRRVLSRLFGRLAGDG
jgi:hypothetical protein